MIHHKLLTLNSSFSNTFSVNFDGTNDYVDLQEPADLIVNLKTTDLSFAAWIYMPVGAVSSSFPAIISKCQPGVPNFGFLMRHQRW
jgi:hypothetical protein